MDRIILCRVAVANRRLIRNLISVINISDIDLHKRYVTTKGVGVLFNKHAWRSDMQLSRARFITLYFSKPYYYQKFT